MQTPNPTPHLGNPIGGGLDRSENLAVARGHLASAARERTHAVRYFPEPGLSRWRALSARRFFLAGHLRVAAGARYCAAHGLPFTGRALEFAEAQVLGPLPLSPLWSRAELVRRRAERQARRRRR